MARFTFAALLLSAVAASASELIARSASDLGSLFPRQSTILDPADIPTECRSACTNIVSSLNSCASTTCLCTSSNGRGLEACVNCLVDLAPTAAMRQQGQTILDNFVSGCGGAVPPLSVGGSSSAIAPSVSTATSASASSFSSLFAPVTRSGSTTSFSTPQRTSTPAGPQTTIDTSGGNPFDDGPTNGAVGLLGYGFMTLTGFAGGVGLLLA